MRIGRLVKSTLIIFMILIVLSAAVIFGLAERVPEDYRIAITRVSLLSEINKPEEDPRRDFATLVSEFSEKIGKGEPVWFTITADEVNLSLASMDEIASYYPTLVQSVHPRFCKGLVLPGRWWQWTMGY